MAFIKAIVLSSVDWGLLMEDFVDMIEEEIKEGNISTRADVESWLESEFELILDTEGVDEILAVIDNTWKEITSADEFSFYAMKELENMLPKKIMRR